MKKLVTAFFAVFLLASCSSPVLKWIDIPAGKGGRIIGQPADKEIVSFSFGIEDETDLPIGKNPDSTGKIPISVILPEGTPVTRLAPAVEYIGKNLTPAPGEAGDFSSPKVYTVTAEDDSSRDYVVKVFLKSQTSKEIVRFALDVSETGSSALTVEGVIDQAAGAITVSVPAGTNTKSLTAHIAHTGVAVQDPLNQSYVDETFSVTSRDFSAPTDWTVTAGDHSAKTYTVTVTREKSHDKEILSFSLVSGDNVIIGGEPQPDGKYPILAIVPPITLPKSLDSLAAFISYTGVSISPAPERELDFRKPETYTVTAEDRSTRDYVVTVISKDDSFDSLARITGFYFSDPLVEGVIDETAQTIALTVPAGTNLSALRPEIYYIGDSISPRDGQSKDFTNSVTYTVRARDGTTRSYDVSVFVSNVPIQPQVDVPGTSGEKVDVGVDADADGKYAIIVELPAFINNPVININPGGTGGIGPQTRTKTINNNNVFNYITMGDNDEYNIVVINPPSSTPSNIPGNAASIDGFWFNSPVAVGMIDETTGTGTAADPIPISVKVPYGTDLRNLAATVCYTGKEIAGIPGSNPLKDSARSFTGPVDYKVNSNDGKVFKTYRVTVTAAKNNAKEITAFSFDKVTPTSAMISAMPNAAGKYPIVVTVPLGQTITNLTAVITHTGASIAGDNISGTSATVTASSPVAFNSTTPVDYTVTAEDGSTKTYAVTVRNAVPDEDKIEITGFYFTEPLAVGAVNQDTDTITVRVPSKTNTASLRPTMYFKGMSVKPGSGAVNNFSGPVTYTVTGISGKTRPYTVTVISTPSSSSDITRFTFPDIPGIETIIGAMPGTDGTYPISIWVPPGTELGNLTPDITNTGTSVTPGPGAPAAGTPGDFNGPQTYTVTAEDGSVKTYTVTVNARSGDAKVITSLVFDEVPVTGGSVRVVASIDQAAHTITADVPFTATVTALKPTLTWIGRSIAGPSGGDKTANPFTDTARNFTSSQKYTVKDQDGAEQDYTVTVILKSSVGVSFSGDVENTIISSSDFDQNTGVVTVTVNSGIESPYEWYVDGVKQPVPTTQDTLALNVGDGAFIPGRHEITVSGKKDGLHYTGKVYFTVSGGTK
jgi:hypothetical protein